MISEGEGGSGEDRGGREWKKGGSEERNPEYKGVRGKRGGVSGAGEGSEEEEGEVRKGGKKEQKE